MDSGMYGSSVPQNANSELMKKAFAELLSMKAQIASMHEEIQSMLKESKELRAKTRAMIDESQTLRARREALLETVAHRSSEVPQSEDSMCGCVVCPDCGKINTVVGATKCVACGRTLSKLVGTVIAAGIEENSTMHI